MALSQALLDAIKKWAEKLPELVLTNQLDDIRGLTEGFINVITDGIVTTVTPGSATIFIDADNLSTTDAFRIYHDGETTPPATLLFTVNEQGEIISEGDLIGSSTGTVLRSRVVDGGAAVGFSIDADNNIVSDGSILYRIQSSGNDRLSLSHGTSALGILDKALLNLFDESGGLSLQHNIDDNILHSSNGLDIVGGSDASTLRLTPAGRAALLSGSSEIAINEVLDQVLITSGAVDSMSAEAHVFDTTNAMVTVGSKIFVIKELGTEVWSIDKDGVSTDGIIINAHVDGGINKHDASEIDVEGTYANIAGTPTDLETALGAIDGKLGTEDIWNRAGTDISPQNSGDRLTFDDWIADPSVTDGAGAIAYDLNTANTISTDGSRLLKISNNNIEHFNIRQGTDLFFGSGAMSEWFDSSGNLSMQFTSNGPTYRAFLAEGGQWDDYLVNDFDFPAGYQSISTTRLLGSQPRIIFDATLDGTGFGQITLNGTGQVQLRTNNSTQLNLFGTAGGNFNSQGPVARIGLNVEDGNSDQKLGITADGSLVGGSNTVSNQYRNWELLSVAANNAASTAFLMRSYHDLTLAGAKLLSLQNLTTEKFAVDKDGNVTLSGTLDGRNIATDGSTLDLHLNGGINKHDASEIDVEGTYANIAGTPTDLESTISAIDSALGGGGVGSSLSSSTSVDVFIDNDNNSTTENFIVYKDVATPTAAQRIFTLNEDNRSGLFNLDTTPFTDFGSASGTLPNSGTNAYKGLHIKATGASNQTATLLLDGRQFGSIFAAERDGTANSRLMGWIFQSGVWRWISFTDAIGTKNDNIIRIDVDGNFSAGNQTFNVTRAGEVGIGASAIAGVPLNIAESGTAGVEDERIRLRGTNSVGVADIGSVLVRGGTSLSTDSYWSLEVINQSGTGFGQAITMRAGDIDNRSRIGIQTTNPGGTFEVDRGAAGTNLVRLAGITDSTGESLRVYRDLASANTDSPVTNIIQDNVGDDQIALRVQQDGTGNILSLFDGVSPVFSVADGGHVTLGASINFSRLATAVDVNSNGRTFIGVTDTGAPRTITLDTDDVIEGRVIAIKDESGGAGGNNITIDTEGAETIDGAGSISINTNYGSVTVYSDGSNWFTY